MYSNNTTVYSVNLPARAICSQAGFKDRSRFIAGTCSLHEDNTVTVLEYREESGQLEQAAAFSHQGQVWAMQASHSDPSKIMTCGESGADGFAVKLWSMPGQSQDEIQAFDFSTSYSNELSPLEELGTVPELDRTCAHNISWCKNKEAALLTSSTYLTMVELTESGLSASRRISVGDGIEIDIEGALLGPGPGAADPHSPSTAAAAFGQHINIVDWRSHEVTSKLDNAHMGCVRDLDFNPNKPMSLVSCGDDRRVHFWDLRRPQTPLLTLQGHSHWVWGCKYNPFHDQLLLTGGSDHVVNLWRVASASSAPWLAMDADAAASASAFSGTEHDYGFQSPQSPSTRDRERDSSADVTTSDDPPDAKVRSLDCHEEAVYGLAWSAADAWIFASMSIDGRIAVNHVPSTEKYKILL